jgi:hypothetical protein
MTKTAPYADGGVEVDLPGGGILPPGKKPKKQKAVQSVKDYLKTHKKDTTYKRVARGAKKHPGASLYELQHGINSKASKAYRSRHEAPIRGGIDYGEINEALKYGGFKILKDGGYADSSHVLASDGKRLYMYGGVIVYDKTRDTGRRYEGLAGDVVRAVQQKLHTGS